MRSQVKCALCGHESNVFDPFLDLSLEIGGCSSLQRALQAFTAPEMLDAQNKYLCERCKRRSCATKRLTIHNAPHVLTIQLKRFRANAVRWRDARKITKFVEFPDRLSLKPFMSSPSNAHSALYQLYAVLVHQGESTRSGHYYCFVRNANNVWYCLNDSQVSQVAAARVMQQQAYILFYSRDSSSNICSNINGANQQDHAGPAVAVPAAVAEDSNNKPGPIAPIVAAMSKLQFITALTDHASATATATATTIQKT